MKQSLTHYCTHNICLVTLLHPPKCFENMCLFKMLELNSVNIHLHISLKSVFIQLKKAQIIKIICICIY